VSNSFKYKRKKLIVFSFEGKNNKTETIYFSHFRPSDDSYILKRISSGVTDPEKMIRETKRKRKEYDYNANEDLTFIFIDGDSKNEKLGMVEDIIKKLPNDITIVLSNPCFEVWYLNHFVKSSRNYLSSKEAISDLCKYINGYTKNNDVFASTVKYIKTAIENSRYQNEKAKSETKTDVFKLMDKIIKIQ